MTSAVGCLGDSIGIILAEGLAGLGQYSYQWNANAGEQANSQLTGLSAGTYTVSATDTIGSTAVGSLGLLNPSNTIALSDFILNIAFNSDNSGPILINTMRVLLLTILPEATVQIIVQIIIGP